MKRLLFLLTLLLAVCCTNQNDTNIRSKLENWDKEIWNKPFTQNDTLSKTILDSLSAINPRKLSRSTEAYYNLLYTIAQDKADVTFKNDSVINLAADIFGKTDDYYNYARSLYYHGVVLYRTNYQDTTRYSLFKKAETLCDTYNFTDNKLLAFVYSQIGVITFYICYYERSLLYHQKALAIFEKENDAYNIINERCNIAYTLLSLNRTDEVLPYLNTFDINDIPNNLSRAIKDCKSLYYKEIGNISESLKYKKELLASCTNDNIIPNVYSIANSYNKLGERDSALVYYSLTKAMLDISDNVNRDRYYKSLHKVYFEYGLPILSKECADSAFAALSRKNDAKIYEIERKYDVFKKDQEIKEVQKRNSLLVIFISLSLIVISSISISFFLFRKKKEAEKRNILLTQKILFLACRTIPKIINDCTEPENSNGLLSAKEIAIYSKIKKKMEKKYKLVYNDFLSNEIIGCTDIISTNNGLSIQEAIIEYLNSEHFSNTEIALLFNTSQEAIRVALYRIKTKK